MSKQASWRDSLLLVVTLSVGAAVVWGVVAGWACLVLAQFRTAQGVHRDVVVLHDGTPLIHTQSSPFGMQNRFESLDGETREMDRSQVRVLPAAYLAGPPRAQLFWVRSPWSERLSSFQDGQDTPNYWYFIDDGNLDGRGYFVGYNSKTKTLVGYLARGGFSPTMPPDSAHFRMNRRRASPDPLATHHYHLEGVQPTYYAAPVGVGYLPSWIQHVLAADGLYRVDFDRRSVTKVVDDESLVSVCVVETTFGTSDDQPLDGTNHLRQVVAVRTTSEIRLIDREGASLQSFTLPEKLRGLPLRFFRTGETQALLMTNDYLSREDARKRSLYWLAQDGTITREERIVIASNYRSNDAWQEFAFGVTVPVPAGWVAGTFAILPLVLMQQGEASGYGDAVLCNLEQVWPGLLVTGLFTVASIWFCVRRQRQYAARGTALWVTLILLFGPAALLAYLVHRPWAARPACPACERPAPRDRDACFACGEPFPAPAGRGIEIFAP